MPFSLYSFQYTGLIIASSGSEFFHVFHVILTCQTLNLFFFPFFSNHKRIALQPDYLLLGDFHEPELTVYFLKV